MPGKYIFIAVAVLPVFANCAKAADEDENILREVSSALVSWWPAEGNAFDLVGRNQGRVTGPVKFVPGHAGLAFSLDGAGSYIDCGSDASLRPGKSFTVALWHRDDEQPRLAPHLISNAEGNARGYLIYMNRKETKDWTFFVGSGASKAENGYAWLFAKDSPRDRWEHLGVTFDGKAMKIYQNGELVTSKPWTNFAAGNTHFYIAGWPEALDFQDDRCFKGAIDDVVLFNRALTDAEVETVFRADQVFAGLAAPDGEQVAELVKALTQERGALEWLAIHRLSNAGDRAAEALAPLAQPARADAKRVEELLAALDAQDVNERDKASEKLSRLGSQGAIDLRAAMQTEDLSPEAKARAALVLKRLEDGGPTGDALPRVRAVMVLEHIGSARALELLDRIASGDPAAPETQASRAAAARILASTPAPATR